MQTEGKELVDKGRKRIETEVDGQNKSTEVVGGDGIKSSGERLAVETVTKEEKQREHRRLGDGKA